MRVNSNSLQLSCKSSATNSRILLAVLKFKLNSVPFLTVVPFPEREPELFVLPSLGRRLEHGSSGHFFADSPPTRALRPEWSQWSSWSSLNADVFKELLQRVVLH